MSLAFSRFAFSRGWFAALFFATAPVSQTIVRAHSTMMPLSHQQHTLCLTKDSVVAEQTHHHSSSEKTKQTPSTETPREKTPPKSQPATTDTAPRPIPTTVTTEPTTEPNTYRKISGFRIQVYTGFADRASRNAALKVQKNIRRRFPEIATYVHFIAPRWICRVGNFVHREDAVHYARLIRAARLSSEAAVVACPILIRQHVSLPK